MEKGGRISDNCKYSSLILYQNQTSISFLKVIWNIKPEIIPINFSYLLIKITSFSYTLLICDFDFLIIYSSFRRSLMIGCSSKGCIFHHALSKSLTINVLTNFITKVFKVLGNDRIHGGRWKFSKTLIFFWQL